MPDRPLKFRVLSQIVRRYGGWEDRSMGKGSHVTFLREINGHIVTYPIPSHKKDVQLCYVRQLRKKLRLTAEDGVSDREFYGD
jgi:hypothetical protein